jgi:hypothetical protein
MLRCVVGDTVVPSGVINERCYGRHGAKTSRQRHCGGVNGLDQKSTPWTWEADVQIGEAERCLGRMTCPLLRVSPNI